MTNHIIPWDCDPIQFPRLLAEIAATQGKLPDEPALRESMDLEQAEINELFDRAQRAWDEIKARTIPNAKLYAVVLDERFSQCERGNIWLVNDEEPGWHNAWIRLQGDIWLEISIRPENYPGLTVQTVQTSNEKLAAHINREFNGGNWLARKCNIDGVEIDSHNRIIGKEDQ